MKEEDIKKEFTDHYGDISKGTIQFIFSNWQNFKRIDLLFKGSKR